MSELDGACSCWWDTEDRGGGYFETVVEIDPDCPEHGRDARGSRR